jgi:hypothetical protein
MQGDSPISNMTEIWYRREPPFRQGRINSEGNVVFYCSDSEGTVIRELTPKIGQAVTILKCKAAINGIFPHVFCIGQASKLVRSGLDVFGNRIESNVDFRQFARSLLKGTLLVDGFLSRIFRSTDTSFYNLTNAVAEFCTNANDIDSLLYPSVRFGAGFNMALKPSAADKFYEFDTIVMTRLEKHLPANRMKMRYVGMGKVNTTGEIMWNT